MILLNFTQLGQMQALNFNNIYYLYIFYYLRFRISLYAETFLEPKVTFYSKNILGLNNQQKNVFNKFSIFIKNYSNKDLIKNSTEIEFSNKNFEEWFIGFTEGDGSFFISKNKSIFSIHVHEADIYILFLIKNKLNMGSISVSKNKTAIYTVKGKNDILFLINLFNGRLYLKKRQDLFKEWVINYNSFNKTNIIIKDSLFLPSLDNYWLSGFTDAEGCFIVITSLRKDIRKFPYSTLFRYVIGQQNAKSELIYIASLIKGNVEKGSNCDRVVVNYLKTNLIINYLNQYPLKTIKAESFKKWLEIHDLMKNKKHLNLEGLTIIKEKAIQINSSRMDSEDKK